MAEEILLPVGQLSRGITYITACQNFPIEFFYAVNLDIKYKMDSYLEKSMALVKGVQAPRVIATVLIIGILEHEAQLFAAQMNEYIINTCWFIVVDVY